MPVASPNQRHLERLLLDARHACIFIPTTEESTALAMIRHAALGTSQPLLTWSILTGIRSGIFEDSDAVKDTDHPAAALFHFTQRLTTPSICVMLDLAAHLQDERTLRSVRDAIAMFHRTGSSLMLIDHADRLPAVIEAEAIRFDLALPDEDELERLVRETVKKLSRRRAVSATLSRRDLKTIVRNLAGLSRRAAERIITDVISDDAKLCADDINRVLAAKRRHLQSDGVLEYIETPVDLNEIGGLKSLKKWLKHREASLSDEAHEFGLEPPRGVLLLGVQGAGKSLSAKAIATAWNRPLLRLDPGSLYDRYVGESEKRLRDALKQAEMMSPIILWIDEIEKGFASAASQSTDGGLSQRMFGTLLTWMQDHRRPVFLVATANNIDALPPELLRKGRFDEIFFVDLPSESVRRQIFEIHLRRRQRDHGTFDVASLAKASEGFSGAEIEQAIIAAMHTAFAGKKELDTEGILDVIQRSPPLSVTAAERIAHLRRWASERCVPAD